MALDVAMIMRLVDRFTAPARKMEQSVDRIAQKTNKLAQSGRSFDRIAAGARRAGVAVRGVYLNAMEKAGAATGNLIRKTADLGLQWAKWGLAGAVDAAGWAGINMIKTAADFEAMEVQITRLLGSAEKGKAAMGWISDFAAKTPYDIGQVTDAFALAKQRGIDPFSGSLRIMGDAAAGSRKELQQAIEAIADAQTGEFERLKEFGITSSVKGDNVVFKYIDREGKEASRSVRKSATEIQGAVLGIWDSLHGGGMEAQSKTFWGIFSNLGDQWTRFQLQVAKAGIFDNIKAKAEGLLTTLGHMAEDGRLAAWAERISNGLEDMLDGAWEFANGVDWRGVASDIGTIAGALGGVVSWIATAVRWAYNLRTALTDAANLGFKASGNPALQALSRNYEYNRSINEGKDPKRMNLFGGGKGSDPAAKLGLPPLKSAKGVKGTKTSMAPQQHEFTVRVRSDDGLKATARPTKMAANSSYSTKRGTAMAGAA